MLEFKQHFENWDQQDRIAVARVVSTWGSAPRPVGSVLIIDEEFKMYGSVSGGCVEGAVLKEAKKLFLSGGGKQLSYGVTNKNAWSVGLSCGGKLEVYLQILEQGSFRTELFRRISENETLFWNTKLIDAAKVENFISKEKMSDPQFFSHELHRKSQMLIVGAAHISSALIHLAKFYDFETIVIDPRSTFADNVNFDELPDKIHKEYPSEVLDQYQLDGDCYAVILSHDPKIDDDALHVLLKSNVAYIGALGSKKTRAKRIERLIEADFSQESLARIYSPIGVAINSRTPKEIALSIMAEIISVKNSKTVIKAL